MIARRAWPAVLLLLPTSFCFAAVAATPEQAAAPPAVAGAEAPELGGVRLGGLRAPPGPVLRGGPKRDEIHSVDGPRFASLEEATWVLAENPVLGVSL